MGGVTLHINVLELKTVLFGLKSFFLDTNGVHIRVQCDNNMAVSYILNMGGVKSIECPSVTKDIWLWASIQNIHLSAEHLPGSLKYSC